MAFSVRELDLLARYVTDPAGDVFCIKGMEGMVGAAYARYSRAKGGFREVLLKEFIEEGVLDPKHAEELIERILIAFGDDSVGELEGAHLSFENISMIATKEIEECRIGGSPIEQSTRYVVYDQRDDKGHYRYYTAPAVAESKHAAQYAETMDFLFTTYTSLVEPMKEFYQKLKPLEAAEYDVLGTGEKQRYDDLSSSADRKAFQRTYTMDIRTRACDTLRSILPLATKTNVGLFGNGRFYQGMVATLLSSPYSEAKTLGEAALRELKKIIPVYVRRAKRNEYLVATEQAMETLAASVLRDVPPAPSDGIVLLGYGEESIIRSLQGSLTSERLRQAVQARFDAVTVATMLYPYSRHPLSQLIETVEKLPETEQQRIRDTYIGDRRTRRDRPYRAFETGYPYTFDLVTDFGTYKDLMRHRMTSQLRQRFSPRLGFSMPPDIGAAGFEKQVLACHERTLELYDTLVAEFPHEASYATLHGSKVRWLLSFNEREAYHLLELRTTPQGHPQYRKACQAMHKLIAERSAWRAAGMKFVDHNHYAWARGDAEAKQRVKERKFDETRHP